MTPSIVESTDFADLLPRAAAGLCVGQVVQVTPQGRLLVDFPGNPGGPVEARIVAAAAEPPAEGTPVVLWFENDDRALPIVMGIVRDRLQPALQPQREARVDGERLVLDAEREIVLRCGESSITLRQDGKILIKGTSLVSHATGTNKIKGAQVTIN